MSKDFPTKAELEAPFDPFDPLEALYDDASKKTIQGISVDNPMATMPTMRLAALHKMARPACLFCGEDTPGKVKISLVDSDMTNVLNTNMELICLDCNNKRFTNSLIAIEVLRVWDGRTAHIEACSIKEIPLEISSCGCAMALGTFEVFIKRVMDKTTGLVVAAKVEQSIREVIKRSYQGLPPNLALLVKLWRELSDVALVKGLTRIDYVSRGGDERRICLQDMALLSLIAPLFEKKHQSSRIQTASSMPNLPPGLIQPGR